MHIKPKKDHTSGLNCFSPTTNSAYFILRTAILGNPSCGICCQLDFKSILFESSDCAENVSIVICSGTSKIRIYAVSCTKALNSQALFLTDSKCGHSAVSCMEPLSVIQMQKQSPTTKTLNWIRICACSPLD